MENENANRKRILVKIPMKAFVDRAWRWSRATKDDS
jgi:hypothetical protein